MTQTTAQFITKRLFNQRPFRDLLFVLVGIFILLGLLVVVVESNSSGTNIHSIEEGLWWAVTTASGVGYGDFVPVTTLGRILGAMLEISGVVMFGVIIGLIGITMGKRQEEYLWFRLFERIDQLESKLASMEKKSSFLVGENQATAAAKNLAEALSKHNEKSSQQQESNS